MNTTSRLLFSPNFKSSKTVARTSLFFLLFFFALQNALHAQGNLMIFPPRVVFKGNTHSEVLGVTNIGADSAVYVLSFLQYRMKEDGSLEEISAPEPGQQFADAYVRFFPRQVMLGPKETQSVRMQVRKPANLPAGEYRSHLYFRAVPRSTEQGIIRGATADSSVSFELIPIFGMTIPVIIRHGELEASVSIGEVYIAHDSTGSPTSINVHCTRKGEASVYVNVIATYYPPTGKPAVVASLNGVAIYTPNPARLFSLALTQQEKPSLQSGRLFVEIIDASDTNKQVLDKKEIFLKSGS